MSFRLLLLLVFICINLEESTAKSNCKILSAFKNLLKSDEEKLIDELCPLLTDGKPDERYVVSKMKELGKGSWGTVRKATFCTAPVVEVAIKQIVLKSQTRKDQVINELKVMKEVGHPNIVKYMDSYVVDNKELWIVMEFMNGGILTDILLRIRMNESEIAYVCREVLKGLATLHAKRWVHRDIKSPNILWSWNGSVKLADFGFAAELTAQKLTLNIGPPNWKAPEVIRGIPYGEKVDVWSFGITVIEMLTGKQPCRDYSVDGALDITLNEAKDTHTDAHTNISKAFKDFLKSCLEVDANKRASAADLLKHNFIKMAADSSDFIRLMHRATIVE